MEAFNQIIEDYSHDCQVYLQAAKSNRSLHLQFEFLAEASKALATSLKYQEMRIDASLSQLRGY